MLAMVRIQGAPIPPRRTDDRITARKTWLSAVPILVFFVVVTGLSVRAALLMNVPGEPNFHQWVMQDFRDGTYYPVVSFLNGGNPYDAARHLQSYPVRQTFSPYSPLYLLVHAPFGLVPQNLSQWLFFALTIGLTLVLGYVVLRMCASRPTMSAVLGIAALALASRPGHWNLLLGQPTLEFVIAVYVAMYVGKRSPWAAGVALAVATMKPTFGVPLAVLMLAQGSYRAVAAGLGIAAALTLVPTAILMASAGGVVPLVASAWDSYVNFGQTLADSPLLCPTRVDAAAIVGRVSGEPLGPTVEIVIFLLLVGLAAAALRRVNLTTTDLAGRLFGVSVACVAILVATYHQSYCALLLLLPLTALVLNRWAPAEFAAPPAVRYVLISLLSIPAVNYFASFSGPVELGPGSGLWRLVTAMNGVALLGALAIYVAIAYRPRASTAADAAADSTEGFVSRSV